MAEYALVENNVPRRLMPHEYVLAPAAGGLPARKVPYSSLIQWTDAERLGIGVKPIIDDPIPPKKIVTGSILENAANVVHRRWTLADRPTQKIPFNALMRRIMDAGLWDAFSDFMNATAQRRRTWDEMKVLRESVPPDNARARQLLAGIGATQQQIDIIMAEPD